jgi:hypothetical protein
MVPAWKLAAVDRGTAGRKNQSKALQDQIRTEFAGEIGHLEAVVRADRRVKAAPTKSAATQEQWEKAHVYQKSCL